MKTAFGLLAVTGLLISSAVAQADTVVNVPAWSYGYHINQLPFTLDAGDWRCELVCPENDPRASFYAWYHVYGNEPWHDQFSHTWHTCFGLSIGPNESMGSGMWNADYGQSPAYWTTVNTDNYSFEFNLPQTTTLGVGVYDNILWDNKGGVSLRFTQIAPPVPNPTPVPAPGSIALLIIGLSVLSGRAQKRGYIVS